MEITAKDIYFVCPAKDLMMYMDGHDDQSRLSESETTQEFYDVLSKFSAATWRHFSQTIV